MEKAIGYVRVSTEKQETKRQIEAVKRHAAAEGMELIAIVGEDEAVSGRSAAVKSGELKALGYYHVLTADTNCWGLLERRGLREILNVVRQHMVNTVIVYALDRISRDTIELLLIEKIMRAFGVRLVCLNAGSAIDTGTAAGRFAFRMMAAVAELECDQVSERTTATLKNKQERGIQVGRPPRGWKRIGDEFVRDPEVWPLVRQVADLRTREPQFPFAAIAQELNIPESQVRRLWKAWNWQPKDCGVRKAEEKSTVQPTQGETR